MRGALYLWSHQQDLEIRKGVAVHLRPIAEEHDLEIVNESSLKGGEDHVNVSAFIDRSIVVVPLVSAQFVEKYGGELDRALRRRARQEVLVIPVLARAIARVSAHDQGIFGLVAIPRDEHGKTVPIVEWDDQDAAHAATAEQIDKALRVKLSGVRKKHGPPVKYEGEDHEVAIKASERLFRELDDIRKREEKLLQQLEQLQRKFRDRGRLIAGAELSRQFRLVARSHSDELMTAWDGWDKVRERIVTVYELAQFLANSKELRTHVERRISALAAIAHRGLLGVVVTPSREDVHDYFVVETLERRLSSVGYAKRLSTNGILSLGLGLGEALKALHDQGIVHGAVQPYNIFMDERGEHKLGCLDPLLGSGARGADTAGQDIWATAYTAPETLGLNTATIDARTDVFGLAMTLTSLFYGADVGRQDLEDIPAIIDKLQCGIRLRHVLRKGTSSDPFGRHGSVDELCRELVAAQRAHRAEASGVSTLNDVSILPMVRIPDGEFEMGGADDAHPHESPGRTVALSAFQIGKYPVTAAEYDEVMALASAPAGGHPDLPATGVSFRDAIEFCNRLSALEGLSPAYAIRQGAIEWDRSADGYRLPLEAEWEFAARGTDKRRYAWGNEPPGWQLCWAGEKPATGERHGVLAHNQPGPEPVNAHPEGASFFGVQDMQGNVFEWCWDWFEKYKPVEGTLHDPAGPDAPEHPAEAPEPRANRILRGGSWRMSDPHWVSAAARAFDDEIVQHADIGFRVARGPKPASSVSATFLGAAEPEEASEQGRR